MLTHRILGVCFGIALLGAKCNGERRGEEGGVRFAAAWWVMSTLRLIQCRTNPEWECLWFTDYQNGGYHHDMSFHGDEIELTTRFESTAPSRVALNGYGHGPLSQYGVKLLSPRAKRPRFPSPWLDPRSDPFRRPSSQPL